jgi:hypothetical protein
LQASAFGHLQSNLHAARLFLAFPAKIELKYEIEIRQDLSSSAIRGLLCARPNRLIAVKRYSAVLTKLIVVNGGARATVDCDQSHR